MKNLTLALIVALTSITACGSEHAPSEPDSGNQNLGGDGQSEETTEALTFVDDILPIIEKRCSLCHNPRSGLPVWTEYEVIFTQKELVRRRVFEIQDMPRGNATDMTEQERELVALWVDDGALLE